MASARSASRDFNIRGHRISVNEIVRCGAYLTCPGNRGQFATQRLSKQLDHTMKPYQVAESAPREAYDQRKMLLTLA